MKGDTGFVNGTHVQSTLRRWYGLLRSPLFWAVVAAATIIAAANGPSLAAPLWQTVRSLLLRFLIAAASSSVASLGIVFLAPLLPSRLPSAPRYALAGFLASPPVAVVVIALIALADGAWPDLYAIGRIAASVVVTVTSVALVVGLWRRGPAGQVAAAAPDGARPSPEFVKRLPPELGGDLTRLSASDHYVEAYTRRGHALVLIRFSDALEELGGADGLQIHRSHWVARSAIRQLVSEGRTLMVELEDGARLPVSRSRLAAVRAEGYPVRRTG